jgi:Glycosyl transferase family 2
MTLVARDEADIIDAQIAFHLKAGVDFIVAIDNGSTDGTTEILESYERAGHLRLIRDDGDLQQASWVTRLARLAATELAADWVINSDVDGFWWPRGGSLQDVLSAVPARFGCVRAMVRHFAPRPEREQLFAERMTVRVCDPGSRSGSPYSPLFQTAHRGRPDVVVTPGNHHARARNLVPLTGWYPIDMLHFPIRSLAQATRKLVNRWEVESRSGADPGPFLTAAYEAHGRGDMSAVYDALVVDDDSLSRGLADGTLAIDTRVRDALRALRNEQRVAFDTVADEAYLREFAALQERMDLLVRADRRANELEGRLAAVEHTDPVRFVECIAGRRRSSSGPDR